MKRPPTIAPIFPDCNAQKNVATKLLDTAMITRTNVKDELKTDSKFWPSKPLERTNTTEIRKAISKLKNGKAPCPDGITAKPLKNAHSTIYTTLENIYNYCLETNYFPHEWKARTCRFLHKHGKPPENPSSYRPITLINLLGKALERIILNRMEAIKSPTPNSQHGFREKLGTATQLTRTVIFIQNVKSRGRTACVVSLDLSKAFNTIDHLALNTKLTRKEMDSGLIKMLQSYLQDRTIRGKYLNELSDPKTQKCGVPQGSVLGPVIFNAYIADIPESCSLLAQYADDACIISESTNARLAKSEAEKATRTLMKYYESW